MKYFILLNTEFIDVKPVMFYIYMTGRGLIEVDVTINENNVELKYFSNGKFIAYVIDNNGGRNDENKTIRI